MQAKIQKWGDDLVLHIPKPLADETGLADDSAVEIRIVDGEIHISRLQTPHYDLDTLLDSITPDTIHGEINTGQPIGKEAW